MTSWLDTTIECQSVGWDVTGCRKGVSGGDDGSIDGRCLGVVHAWQRGGVWSAGMDGQGDGGEYCRVSETTRCHAITTLSTTLLIQQAQIATVGVYVDPVISDTA